MRSIYIGGSVKGFVDWTPLGPRDPCTMLMGLIVCIVRLNNLCIIFDPVMLTGLCVSATLPFRIRNGDGSRYLNL